VAVGAWVGVGVGVSVGVGGKEVGVEVKVAVGGGGVSVAGTAVGDTATVVGRVVAAWQAASSPTTASSKMARRIVINLFFIGYPVRKPIINELLGYRLSKRLPGKLRPLAQSLEIHREQAFVPFGQVIGQCLFYRLDGQHR
jgi:hypothetical protein